MEWQLYFPFKKKSNDKEFGYSGTSRKQPPLMSGLCGCLLEVVTYGGTHWDFGEVVA